ncbi:alpha/beta fold hydrolase, partial [Pseudomonas aeruginosa]
RLTGSAPVVRTDDGVRLHIEADGPADAPVTVVFAHGFAARSTMFDPQWSALRGRDRLVRYDQRGHGASGWAGVRSATVDRLGRDLE